MMMGLLASLLWNTSCQSHKEEHEEEATFQITSPVVKDTIITNDYVCQIHAISHIELRAQEKGFLQDIYVDEGQHVKKGDLLFGIMPKLYEAEVHKAKAEADYAEIEYKNTKMLADSNVVSPNQLALDKAHYEKAKAELELAEVHLGFTQIRAPFDGIIDKFHVRLGSLIDEGELITNLSDNNQMWVYYNVSEAEYLDYMTSSNRDSTLHVKLQMANGQIFEFEGLVETIEADFNNETGNVAFRATFPNPNGILRHGQTGNVLMDVPYQSATIIPQKCTFEVLDKKYVYVIDENNVVHPREIEIAQEMPHLYIVRSGLSADDKILLDGIRKVKDGDEIKTEFQEPNHVIATLELPAE